MPIKIAPQSTPGPAKTKMLSIDFLNTYQSQLKAESIKSYQIRRSIPGWKSARSYVGLIVIWLKWTIPQLPNFTGSIPWTFRVAKAWECREFLIFCLFILGFRLKTSRRTRTGLLEDRCDGCLRIINVSSMINVRVNLTFKVFNVIFKFN